MNVYLGYMVCLKVYLDDPGRQAGTYSTYVTEGQIRWDRYLGAVQAGSTYNCKLSDSTGTIADWTKVVRGPDTIYFQSDGSTGHPLTPKNFRCDTPQGGGMRVNLEDWAPGTMPYPMPTAGQLMDKPYKITCEKWIKQ